MLDEFVSKTWRRRGWIFICVCIVRGAALLLVVRINTECVHEMFKYYDMF